MGLIKAAIGAAMVALKVAVLTLLLKTSSQMVPNSSSMMASA